MGHCRCRKSQVARRKDAKYCRHKPPSPAPAPSKLPPNSLQMEMAKYQGWRGVQGNFRGKVEVQLQLGWLQRKVDKYQGWRGVQGNFRGKVEERVQQKGNRRGGAGPGWLAAAPTTGPRKKQRKGGKVS